MFIIITKGAPRFVPMAMVADRVPQLAACLRIHRAAFAMTDRLAITIDRDPALLSALEAPLLARDAWMPELVRQHHLGEVRCFECDVLLTGFQPEHQAYRVYGLERPDIRELAWLQAQAIPRIVDPTTPEDTMFLFGEFGITVEHVDDRGQLLGAPPPEALRALKGALYPTAAQPARHRRIECVRVRVGSDPVGVAVGSYGRYVITVGSDTLRRTPVDDLARMCVPPERQWLEFDG